MWAKMTKNYANGKKCACRESVQLFAKLMQRTNLKDLLDNPSPSYTVFAPSDAHLYKLLKKNDFKFNSHSELQEFVESHIVPNATVLLNEMKGLQTIFGDSSPVQNAERGMLETDLVTVNGKRITLMQHCHPSNETTPASTAQRAFVNMVTHTANIIEESSDVLCSNGVVHSIEGTMYDWGISLESDSTDQVSELLGVRNIEEHTDGSEHPGESEEEHTTIPQLLFSGMIIALGSAVILGLVYVIMRRQRQYDSITMDSVDDVINEVRKNSPERNKQNYGTVNNNHSESEIHSLLNGSTKD